MKSTSSKEHRQSKRSSITVRVKCLPPGVAVKRNGHVAKGWEMLARDINHDGVRLRWSRRWAEANCPHCLKGVLNQFSDREICVCTPPDEVLRQGQHVTLDGLVYTHKGSVTMKGSVRWVRQNRKGDIYDVGVLVTSSARRQLFPALESVGR